MIQIAIQIECSHGTKFLDPDSDPDNVASCKRGIRCIDSYNMDRVGLAQSVACPPLAR